MIEIETVGVRRAGAEVLSGVSLSLKSGVTALVGPSGSGKTTLLRVIAGLDAPDAGSVRIAGEVASKPGKIVVFPEQRRIAMVFQDLALWPHLDVRQNLEFGLRARKMPGQRRRAAVAEMLELVGLADKAERRPDSLSGGERQRVALARALVLDPIGLLLDEPLGNLDVVSKDELLALIRRLVAERNVPTLFVTHDPREAGALADRTLVLESGRIVQSGRFFTAFSAALRKPDETPEVAP